MIPWDVIAAGVVKGYGVQKGALMMAPQAGELYGIAKIIPNPDCQCNQCQARKRAIATYNELKAIKDAARYSPEAAGTTASSQ